MLLQVYRLNRTTNAYIFFYIKKVKHVTTNKVNTRTKLTEEFVMDFAKTTCEYGSL